MASRQAVYEAIDGERVYQAKVWNEDTTPSGGKHEVAAFLTYMREYLNRADFLASTVAGDGKAGPGSAFEGESALDMIRKVTALGVACMEQNGAPKRQNLKDQEEPGCEHVSGPYRCSNCAYES